jgi:hypothetical protein
MISITIINEQDIYGNDIQIKVIGKSVPIDRDYRDTYGSMLESLESRFEIIEISIDSKDYEMTELSFLIGCHVSYIKDKIQEYLHRSAIDINYLV